MLTLTNSAGSRWLDLLILSEYIVHSRYIAQFQAECCTGWISGTSSWVMLFAPWWRQPWDAAWH